MTYGIANPNGLKTQEITLGMPQSGYIVITINDPGSHSFNSEGEYLDNDSDYARAVNAIGMYSDIYATYTPESAQFLVQVRGDSLPLTVNQELGDGTEIEKITDIATEILGYPVTAWNARVADDSVTWDF